MPAVKTEERESLKNLLSQNIFDELTQLRIDDPERAFTVARKRKRRKALCETGKLTIIACDHPARRVVRVADQPLAMANREVLLTRVVRILDAGFADGVMGTMDVLTELLLLDELIRLKGGESFLNDRLMIPSLNRGGLDGTSWELDDPLTGPTPVSAKEWNMDGVKLLLRLCDTDPNSLKTLKYCADAITQANRVRMPVMLEPLPVIHNDSGYKVVKEARALAKIIGVASALGESGQNMWLKLPYCKNFEVAAKSTTMPILILGGESAGQPYKIVDEVRDAMASSPNVRGTMIGRNILFPSDLDPVDVAAKVHEAVQGRQKTARSKK